MALKFLNKKGWHTGSIRNIENVWKAEQKHEAEQKKLEELRKQIQDERERDEFRLLQEQAGLVPRQERLDFLYESGLAVGKGSESGSGFKALEGPPAAAAPAAADLSSSKAAVPGALFEDKPHSANDAWRKLHSDPLLLIRQREQEALARIKNNPIQMAMIRKSMEAENNGKKLYQKEKRDKKKHKEHHPSESKNKKHSSKAHSASEDSSEGERDTGRREHSVIEHRLSRKSKNGRHLTTHYSDSEDTTGKEKRKREYSRSEGHGHHSLKYDTHSSKLSPCVTDRNNDKVDRRKPGPSSSKEHQNDDVNYKKHSSRVHSYSRCEYRELQSSKHRDLVDNKYRESDVQDRHQSYGYNCRLGVPKLSEEERAARLREMQADAELHEEQRWKRLKKAADSEAQEAMQSRASGSKTFLDDAQKRIFGTEKGGSATIEESVRRRTFYSQGGMAASESNAFRR